MKIVNVTYTTPLEFSGQNQENILRVMSDLKTVNHSGIRYAVCLCADGKTFKHTAFFKSEPDQLHLNELPSFKAFQSALRTCGLESNIQQEVLTLVGTNHDIF